MLLFAVREPSIYDTLVKLAVVLVLTPFWWPILKAIYRELNGALWREGGLFGRAPAGADLARREREEHGTANPLVSIPLASRRAPAAQRRSAGGGAGGPRRGAGLTRGGRGR